MAGRASGRRGHSVTPPPRTAERPNRIVPGALLNALNALMGAKANLIIARNAYNYRLRRAKQAGATPEDIRRALALIEIGRKS